MKNLKYNRRQMLAGICVTMAIACFASCGEKAEVADSAVLDSQVTDSAEDFAETRQHGENSDAHIYKEYSEDFIADAEIISLGNDRADILIADRYRFDREKIASLFFGDNIPTVTPLDNGDLYFEASDGTWAYLSDGYFHYATNHRYEVQLPFEHFSSDEEFVNLIPRYFQVYKKDRLDFMAPDEVIQKVKGFLSSFDIQVSDNVEIHAIDCETMQEYQDYVRENDPDSAKNYRIKEHLTKDDEFYYICFPVEQDGIPVTRYSVNSGSGVLLLGSNIKVCFSQHGIFEFSAENVYTVDNTVRSADRLLSAEEALDSAFEVFHANSSLVTARVEQLRFEYVMEPNDPEYSRVTYKPVWSMIVFQQDETTELMEKAWEEKNADKASSQQPKGKYDITGYAQKRHIWIIDAESGEMLSTYK